MGWCILTRGGAAYYPCGYGGGSSDGYGVVYCEPPLPPSAVYGCFGRLEELPGLLARTHLCSPPALILDFPPREIKEPPIDDQNYRGLSVFGGRTSKKSYYYLAGASSTVK